MAQPLPPTPGIYVPAVVFFKDDEELDFGAIKNHVLRLAQGGVTGILCQGSNGEAQHLTHGERSAVIRFTRQTLDENGFKDVLVIAGTGGQSTRETKKLNEDAKAAGASHALILTPSTWKPVLTKDLIVEFYRQVADESPIPTMIYNFATVTAGLDLDSHTIAAAGQHPNIVGCKLSCGHLGKLSRLANTPSLRCSFSAFVGRSDSFFPALCVGSPGGIMALVNIAPRAHVALWNHYQAGRIDEAKEIHRVLADGDGLGSKYGGIGFLKAIIAKEFGYGNALVRGPLASGSLGKLSEDDKAILKELIDLEKSL
ncbi:aldolase [Vararia minispora EC-137]|uniref:Aldolase n=1 Tax=Vararia minispora EC-137 TaxID=1314806 RepID=A0ACB8QQS7_9AGAM|nr:aldolase [Vararia minispora EC-137]